MLVWKNHLKKLVSCLCPWSNAIFFLLVCNFPVALVLVFFLSVVSLSRSIRLAAGDLDISFPSQPWSVWLPAGKFSLSLMDSVSVLFLVRHFGVPSIECSFTLPLKDDIISFLTASIIIWSLLMSGLGPILILKAGLAQLMSPHTFL